MCACGQAFPDGHNLNYSKHTGENSRRGKVVDINLQELIMQRHIVITALHFDGRHVKLYHILVGETGLN